MILDEDLEKFGSLPDKKYNMNKMGIFEKGMEFNPVSEILINVVGLLLSIMLLYGTLKVSKLYLNIVRKPINLFIVFSS